MQINCSRYCVYFHILMETDWTESSGGDVCLETRTWILKMVHRTFMEDLLSVCITNYRCYELNYASNGDSICAQWSGEVPPFRYNCATDFRYVVWYLKIILKTLGSVWGPLLSPPSTLELCNRRGGFSAPLHRLLPRAGEEPRGENVEILNYGDGTSAAVDGGQRRDVTYTTWRLCCVFSAGFNGTINGQILGVKNDDLSL